MSYLSDLLTSTECKKPGANPVYHKLLAYVESQFPDKPQVTQAIVFAIAYTNCCRNKKLFVNELIDTASAQNASPILNQQTFDNYELTVKHAFKNECSNAFSLLKQLESDLLAESLNEINALLKPISDTVTNIDQQLYLTSGRIVDVKSVADRFDQKDKLAEKKLSDERSPGTTTWRIAKGVFSFFIIDSAKHFILLLIALFGWAAGALYLIQHYVPTIQHSLHIFIEKEGEDLLKPPPAAQPESQKESTPERGAH